MSGPSQFQTWDDYFIPGTQVLKNKLGITDAAELRKAEYELSDLRVLQLQETPVKGSYDLDHYLKIHQHIFQDVYEWAGQQRSVAMSKGGTAFVRPEDIGAAMQEFHRDLKADNFFKGLPKDLFVDKLSAFYADVNAAHPGREGNGRATRVFIDQLAKEAGYSLDQTRIDNSKAQFNEAAKRSANHDLDGIREIFNAAIRPTRAIAFERLSEKEALASHPELAGAFRALREFKVSVEQVYPSNKEAQHKEMAAAREEIVRNLETGRVLTLPPRQKSSPEYER